MGLSRGAAARLLARARRRAVRRLSDRARTDADTTGLRLIAPDAPGFGQSPPLPPERYELDSLVDLLRGVLDDRGLEQALLMGHSWGGSIITGFAARYPGPRRRAGLRRQRPDGLPGLAELPARQVARGPDRGRGNRGSARRRRPSSKRHRRASPSGHARAPRGCEGGLREEDGELSASSRLKSAAPCCTASPRCGSRRTGGDRGGRHSDPAAPRHRARGDLGDQRAGAACVRALPGRRDPLDRRRGGHDLIADAGQGWPGSSATGRSRPAPRIGAYA